MTSSKKELLKVNIGFSILFLCFGLLLFSLLDGAMGTTYVEQSTVLSKPIQEGVTKYYLKVTTMEGIKTVQVSEDIYHRYESNEPISLIVKNGGFTNFKTYEVLP